MSLRPVFRTLITCYVRHEAARTLLTVLGVALGVAVLVAIELASASALQSFKSTVRDIAGDATVTVSGNAAGLPGTMVGTLEDHPVVEAVSPLISGKAVIPDAAGEPVSALLLGVDFLDAGASEESSVRDLTLELSPDTEFVTLLTDPRTVVLSRSLSESLGIQPGASFEATVGRRSMTLTAGGLIESGDLSRAYAGRVILADLGVADYLLSRQGLLDRIDLITREEVPVEEALAALRDALPETVIVERPERRNARVDEMVSAFRFNLIALGHVSLLVGAFLIYNTMSISVLRRRKAIGTLRAMGIGRSEIRWVFLAEGLAFGALGGLAGLGLGILLAESMLAAVSEAISINFVETSAEQVTLSLPAMAGAWMAGVLFSLVAAWGPSREASRTSPANTIKTGIAAGGASPGRARLLLGLLFAAGAVTAVLGEASPGLPVRGYAASLLFLGSVLCWNRLFLAAGNRLLRPAFQALFGAEGMIAMAGIRATLPRAGVAVGGLFLSVAMTVSVSVMVASFRDTVVTWMQQVLLADLYVSVESGSASSASTALPPSVADRVSEIPGVAKVDPFRSRQILYEDRLTWVGAGRFDAARFGSRTLDGRPMEEVLAEAAVSDGVIVSEAFARKSAVQSGQTILLPTPAGARELRVVAVYRDFSREQGYVIMDRSLYLRLFGDPLIDSVAVYLKDGADRAAVKTEIDAVLSALPASGLAFVRANDEVREYALSAFDRTFGVTYALQFIAIAVAVLGVTTTLLAQVLDRRHEIATLRTLGASKTRVIRIVLIESVFLGLLGVFLGILAGLVLSWILTKVIMLQSFGWSIDYRLTPLLLAQISGLVFLSTIAASILPAREAVRSEHRNLQTVSA